MRVGGLFDGCGLLAYGLTLAGFEHAWLCEKDEFRRELLRLRWPGVPVYDDVRAVDGRAARVDLVAGGFPCKGISSAGSRTGFGHPETALWREQLRVIRDVRPRYVLVENVADLLSLERGELFGEVLGGLAESGYDAEWDCFPAAAFGAPHGRDRVFVTALAHADDGGCREAESPLRTGESDAARGSGAAPDAHGDDGREARLAGPGAVAADEDGRRSGDGGRPVASDSGGGGRVAGRRLRSSDSAGLGRGRSPDGDREAAADADKPGRGQLVRLPAGRDEVHADERRDADGRGVEVSWDAYEPAVRRWEALIGRSAPEPLLRRMDDGRAGRVERSRLSALGDGVLVYAGWLCGRRIMEHAMTLCDPPRAPNSHSGGGA